MRILNYVRAFRLANYIGNRIRQTDSEVRHTIPARHGIVHQSVSVPGLIHLDFTEIRRIGRENGDNPQDVSYDFPPTGRSESYRLLRHGIVLDGWGLSTRRRKTPT